MVDHNRFVFCAVSQRSPATGHPHEGGSIRLKETQLGDALQRDVPLLWSLQVHYLSVRISVHYFHCGPWLDVVPAFLKLAFVFQTHWCFLHDSS